MVSEMSHKEDRERASQGNVFRDGQIRSKCCVPQCDELAEPDSPFEACLFCTKVIYIFAHAIPRLKTVQKQPENVLLVPKPGMEKAAIEEARKAGGL